MLQSIQEFGDGRRRWRITIDVAANVPAGPFASSHNVFLRSINYNYRALTKRIVNEPVKDFGGITCWKVDHAAVRGIAAEEEDATQNWHVGRNEVKDSFRSKASAYLPRILAQNEHADVVTGFIRPTRLSTPLSDRANFAGKSVGIVRLGTRKGGQLADNRREISIVDARDWAGEVIRHVSAGHCQGKQFWPLRRQLSAH